MPYGRRRRRYYGSRPVNNPPAPKPTADPLPLLRKDIEKVYKEYGKLVVSDANTRAEALIRALEPLDKIVRIAVVRKQTPPDANRLWEIAAKCRARAMGTPFPEEKETAIRIAISKIDRIVASMQVPKFEEAQTALDGRIASFAAMQAAKAARKAGIHRERIPRVRPVAAPVDLSGFGRTSSIPKSPYQPGSCRGIMFEMMLNGEYTEAELAAATVGKAQHPEAVFRCNFYPRRNKTDNNERFFKWQVVKENNKFHVVVEKPGGIQ
jgi:hypothetical protein